MPNEFLHSSSLSSPSSNSNHTATTTSPHFRSISTPPSVLDWNESQVHQFFVSLGLPRFEHAIREHAVTGDVLVHLDNELLKDMGVLSVGKRLALLKAIYKLKLREDIPIDDGHWVPPSGDVDLDELDESTSSSSYSPATPNHSLIQLIQSRDQKISSLECEIRSIRLDLQAFASRLIASNPTSPVVIEGDRHVREESMNQLVISEQPARSPRPDLQSPSDQYLDTSHILKKPLAGPTDQNSSSSSSTTPTNDSTSTNTVTLPSLPSASTLAATSPKDPATSPLQESSPTPTNTETTPSKDKDIHNPYKSFRVTLEDPCYKVLPAALKKYKIKEHYKNYVLFICYGKQERCLSYEEKPLLLFQKLKEANQNPVFTLRHIKDIESPISIALAKQAQRRESMRKTLDGGSTVSKRMAGNNGGVVEPTTGFCVAIYPYMSEGEEDFDVGVGDTFLIVGKSKGWWVVHRDLGDGKVPEGKQPGWVPSGCVLETKQSFAISNITYSTPILPEHILSVSSCTNALMDYKAKGVDELSLSQGDSLRVYKKYNNWSYAINETHADKPRGWTPSWLVGGRKDSLTSSATSTLKSKRSGSNLLAPKSLEGIQIKQDNFQSREQELGIQMSAA